MALTLTAGISATARTIAITGTVPDEVVGGYQFRLGDELLEFQGFARGNHGARSPLNVQNWYVRRGLGVSTAASHDAGTSILGAVDAFAASTTGTTPPNPFADGGGAGTVGPWEDPATMTPEQHGLWHIAKGDMAPS